MQKLQQNFQIGEIELPFDFVGGRWDEIAILNSLQTRAGNPQILVEIRFLIRQV
jgi:hypothetical protein